MDTEMLLDSVIDGFNVCIFAYGQTGSGKTYTMAGTPESPGLTPRCVKGLFERVKSARSHGLLCTVRTYFVELYNDRLVDLLRKVKKKSAKDDKDAPKLDIKVDARKQVYVKNAEIATVAEVGGESQLLELFTQGNKMRKVGATKMNAASSRSHSIFSIIIETEDSSNGAQGYGKLSLIDLAGSERLDRTGATGDRLKEAQAINKSLSCLGDVFASISNKGAHHTY